MGDNDTMEYSRDARAELALRTFRTLCSTAQVFLVPSRRAVTQSVIDGYSRSSRARIDQFVALTCALITNAYMRHCSNNGAIFVELCLSTFVRTFASSRGWNTLELQDDRVYFTERSKKWFMITLCFVQLALHGSADAPDAWSDRDSLSPPL